MTEDIVKRKEEFKQWMKTIYKEDGTVYGETVINAFCYSLEQATSKLKVATTLDHYNIFGYDNIKMFNRAYGIIVSASNYAKVDMATGNRTFSASLLHYSNFLKATVKHGKKSQLKASFIKWFNPILQVLRDVGEPITISQLQELIIQKYDITELELSYTNGNKPNSKGSNKFQTEITFAINYLVIATLVDDSLFDCVSLTALGIITEITDELALKIFNEGVASNKAKTNRPKFIKKYWIYPIEKMYKTDTMFVSDDGIRLSNWSEFKENKILTIPFGELGDLRGYNSKSQMKEVLKDCFGHTSNYLKTSLLAWQFVNDMQIGDIVIIQENNKILGRGVVKSDYGLDENRDDNYNHTREIIWTDLGEWYIKNPKIVNTLTDATKYLGYIDEVNALFDDNVDELQEEKALYQSYNDENFLTEVYMKDEEYHRLVNLLNIKQNIILQGPAGVGKTFISKRLAYSLIGEKSATQVKMIQFHQSYSYEDFFMGYRPTNDGLELKYGVFYNFCKQAELDDENNYYFIIDEINRGNLSKIFGELFILIENDKRGEEIQLTYTNEMFSIPKNVYIIGMMNTADRGLAMLDYALRRRFGFYEINPAFDSVGFMGYQASMNNAKLNKIILEVKNLNKEIEFDENLGKGFAIGHSYFSNKDNVVTDEWLKSVVDFELMALLNEYWFDEPDKVLEWKKRLNEALE